MVQSLVFSSWLFVLWNAVAEKEDAEETPEMDNPKLPVDANHPDSNHKPDFTTQSQSRQQELTALQSINKLNSIKITLPDSKNRSKRT